MAKKRIYRVEMTEGKRNGIRQLLKEYDIETAKGFQNVLEELMGGAIKEMMEATLGVKNPNVLTTIERLNVIYKKSG